MAEKIRVVLAGCGGMSGAWLKAAGDGGKFEVVGLVDINEVAARKRKEEFGLEAAQTGDSLDAMLKATGAEAVFDCTIPKAHKEITLTALANGCHILGEKPIAENLEDAREMVEAARKSGRIYAVIQNRRYIPSIRAVRDFIAAGTLGRLTTLDVDFYLGPHFGGFREEMEHVLLVDMAIHTFVMARFISGADPVSVYCKERNPAGSWYRHGASAVAIFEMSNGLVFTYRGSWCAEGMNTTWEGDWRMVCENGSATWDGANDIRAQKPLAKGKFMSDMIEIKVPVPDYQGPILHGALIEEFADCVRNGKTPQTICTDNIKSFGMVMAAVRSAESGRPMPVEF